MCCKLTSRATHESLSQEYSALQQILDAGLTPLPRVPCLKGVVESKEGDVVGILIEYINKTLPNLADALSKDDIIDFEIAHHTRPSSMPPIALARSLCFGSRALCTAALLVRLG
jgi:hypothetical protein